MYNSISWSDKNSFAALPFILFEEGLPTADSLNAAGNGGTEEGRVLSISYFNVEARGGLYYKKF